MANGISSGRLPHLGEQVSDLGLGVEEPDLAEELELRCSGKQIFLGVNCLNSIANNHCGTKEVISCTEMAVKVT